MLKIRSFLQTFFDHPGRALAVMIGFITLLWTIQCSLTQNILGLDVIETIVWGEQGQLGHFKHPPLSGWIGYAFSWISGHADWSMYLAAQLCIALGAWYTYKLAKEFFPETTAAAAALLLYTLPYSNPSPMKFCSHFVESALQPVMAYYFYLAIRDNKKKDYFLLGIVSGLAFLGKYSALMLIAAFFVYMLIDKDARRRFTSIGPWIAGITAFLVVLPHLHWLWQHDFSCLRHLDNRINLHKEAWYFPFVVAATAVYPFFLEGAYLAAAFFPHLKGNPPHKTEKKPLIYAAVLTIVPALFLVGVAIAGKQVVLMWFSSMGSWIGIALAALFPFVITRDVYRKLYYLILIYTAVIFIGTTIDILNKPRLRCHLDPQQLVSMAKDYCRRTAGTDQLHVVIGERWFTGVLENYSPERPAACDLDDPVAISLVRDRIKKHGAMLIHYSPKRFRDFLKNENLPEDLPFERRKIIIVSPFGKTDDYKICFGYYPPEKTVQRAAPHTN